MIQRKSTYNRLIKLFSIIMFVALICFSSVNVQAQFLPFPVYPYFSPFAPFAPAPLPILAPQAFSFLPSPPPGVFPFATIQGSTIIYIPSSVSTFNFSVSAPGTGVSIPKLTGLAAPFTVFIYPAGYVPPAPVLPPIIAPAVVPPTVIAPPTVFVPTVIAPTFIPTAITPTIALPTAVIIPSIAPTVAISPSSTVVPAAVSGLLWQFSPFFPSFFPAYPIL